MGQSCVLCRCSEENELAFGAVHELNNIMVHRNCLYLSSNLIQQEETSEGILNFRMEDIEAEVNRCRTLMCYYCRRLGANIGCCKSGCRRTFHTKCGFDNLAQSQFRDTYKSYCHQHVKLHRHRPTNIKQEPCVICSEKLVGEGERFSVVTSIYLPCCRNGWFHRKCLQRYANSSGYFFKCPLCNNVEVFRKVVLMGISVLNQDASWETEPDAYADQFRRETTCTATTCVAECGREDTSITLLYCHNCGAHPAHFTCTPQNYHNYVCKTCSPVLPNPIPYIPPENDSNDGDSIDEAEFEAPAVDAPVEEQGDLIHLKLSASTWDNSDSSDEDDDEDDNDDDDDDDDDVFNRAVASRPQQNISDDQPSTSAAARALAARNRSSPARTVAARNRSSPARTVAARNRSSPARTVAARNRSSPARTVAARNRSSPARTVAARPRSSPARTVAARNRSSPARTVAARNRSSPARTVAARNRSSPARTVAARNRSSPARTVAARNRSSPARTVAARNRISPARALVARNRSSPARTVAARTHSSSAAAGSLLGSRPTAAPSRGSYTTFESPRGSQATTLISRTSAARASRATTTAAPTAAGSPSTPTLDNQENTEPSSSNVRRSLRPRRTMPARVAATKESSDEESDENVGAEPKKPRRSSTSGRRSLRPISPEPSTSAPRTLRRRTLANLHPTYTNLDLSCVANRTRNRLSTRKN